MITLRRLRGPLLLLALVGGVGPARAEPGTTGVPAEEAKSHFEEGRKAYLAGDFERAIREFTAAQRLLPSPVLEYNMGLSYEGLGQPGPAVEHYRLYIVAKPDAPNADEVRRKIADLSPPASAAPPATTTPRPGEPSPNAASPRATDDGAGAPPICYGGQLATSDTAGHCCWAGQVWSNRRATCVGAPSCPPGLIVQGETCVPTGVSPVMPPAQWTQPMVAEPPHPPGTVPVRFAGRSPKDHFVVRVGPTVGAVPCTLYLPPGRAKIDISGDASFKKDLIVPDYAMTVKVHRISIAAYVVGAIFATAGIAAIVYGAGAVSSSVGTTVGEGAIAIFFGAGGVALGIPFLATGGRNKLSVKSGIEGTASAGGLRLAGVGLAPTSDGAAASALFRF